MLSGACLQEYSVGNESTIELFHQYTIHLANLFSIPWGYSYNQESKFKEYFYIPGDGDERFNNTPVMSLAMEHKCGQENKIATRYCSHANRNMNAKFVTYGIGLQRLFFVIIDYYRENKGFNFTKMIRPFDITLTPRRDEDISACVAFADCLQIPQDRILIDDRNKIPLAKKKFF